MRHIYVSGIFSCEKNHSETYPKRSLDALRNSLFLLIFNAVYSCFGPNFSLISFTIRYVLFVWLSPSSLHILSPLNYIQYLVIFPDDSHHTIMLYLLHMFKDNMLRHNLLYKQQIVTYPMYLESTDRALFFS